MRIVAILLAVMLMGAVPPAGKEFEAAPTELCAAIAVANGHDGVPVYGQAARMASCAEAERRAIADCALDAVDPGECRMSVMSAQGFWFTLSYCKKGGRSGIITYGSYAFDRLVMFMKQRIERFGFEPSDCKDMFYLHSSGSTVPPW